MKIAVFENEYQQVEAAFETVNLLYFNNEIQFINYPSSQSFGSLENLKDFSVAIVDIDLSQKSQLDGYALLSRIEKLEKKPKILILTGSSRVEESLKIRNFPAYDILSKPIDFTELNISLNKIFAKA